MGKWGREREQSLTCTEYVYTGNVTFIISFNPHQSHEMIIIFPSFLGERLRVVKKFVQIHYHHLSGGL